MAKLTFDIPDDKVHLIVDGWCVKYGYQEHIPQPLLDEVGEVVLDEAGEPDIILVPNPQSKIQFVKEQIRLMIKVEAVRGLKTSRMAVLNEGLAIDRNSINGIEIT